MFSVIAVLFGFTFKYATSTGCTLEDGTIVGKGEQYDLPDVCGLNVCEGYDRWTQCACVVQETPPGWRYVPEDTSKGYPECCGHAIRPCRVVPDVVDDVGSYHGPYLEFPKLDITYHGVTVEHCTELTPSLTQIRPEVSYTGEPLSWSLLAMVDPDAPSRFRGRQFVHWLVGNIPDGRVGDGEALTEYFGPSPPKGTGLHRYVFLLFKQPQKLNFDEPRTPAGSMNNRGSFAVRDFAKKYQLGDPEVANVFEKLTILYQICEKFSGCLQKYPEITAFLLDFRMFYNPPEIMSKEKTLSITKEKTVDELVS